jgi:hypothetical protein
MKTTYKNFTILIEQDNDPMNPRTEWDNFGIIAYKHRNYILGEEEINDPDDFLAGLAGLEPDKDNLMERAQKKNVILPVYLYDHSGITISCRPFSCPWDSGQVGYIYATYEQIRKEYNVKHVTTKVIEKVKNRLRSEIETFDNYLTGEVYGFTVEDEDGEMVDSCSGYYGENGIKDAINTAKDSIDCEIKQRTKNRYVAIKQMIRSKIPLHVRMEKIENLPLYV